VGVTFSVILASTLVQIAAAVVALRLVWITGRRRAWFLIAVALTLMVVRRGMTLLDVVFGHVESSPGLLRVELVALAISVILLAGLALIAPLFRRIGADAEEARRLAARLSVHERRLRTVLDAIPEAFLVLVSGRIVFANRSVEKLFGVAAEVAVGMDIEELGGSALADVATAQPPGTGFSATWDMKTGGVEVERAGVTVWVDVAVRFGSWDDRPARICLIADATESREGRDSLSRERGLFAAGPVVLMRWSAPPDRVLEFVTENGRSWGFDPDAVPGAVPDFHSLVEPDDLERIRGEARRAFEEGRESWSNEYRLVCPDGMTRWVYDVTVVGRDRDGKATHFDGYLLDITDRKLAEEALAASEERFRLAAAAVHEVIYDWDVASDRLVWWTSADLVFGWPADELPGTGNDRLANVHPEDVAAARAALENCLATGDVYEAEYRVRRRDGGWAAVVDRALVVGDGGSSRRVIGALLDLSEQRKLEEQLNLSRRLEAVGSLAGGVAHDFNNLLTAIIASADLLQLALPAGDPGHAEVRTIKGASKRAAELTHALLAFARRQVLQPVDIDLNELVEDFLPMLRRVIPENIEIDFIRGHELATVRADRGQVEQILMNLCLNSRDAMGEGGTLTIETENTLINGEYVKSHPWAKAGRYVLLSVSDSGSGMDEATVRHAFEPFYTTKRVGKGTGLGLATVYGIVKQHSGMVSIYSEVDKGTTVKVYLPIVVRRAVTVGNKVEGPALGGNETILVVEDDATVRRSTVTVLSRLGYTVLEAADGLEALELLRSAEVPPALVVSDIVMPRMGGRELAQQAAEVAPGTVFLFSSGYTENGMRGDLKAAAGTHFIAKPYGLDVLARKIRTVLDGE